MVAPDDGMGAAVVPADDRVPQRLAEVRHSLGEIEQVQCGGPVGEVRRDALVAAHPGEAVDVAGQSRADDGMDEEARLACAGSFERELDLGAVHGVAGLKDDDAPPAEGAETFSELRWRMAPSGRRAARARRRVRGH